MEQRIKDYKNRHMGELPQQMEPNLRMLAGLQDRLRNNEAGTRTLEERKVFLEAQIGLIGNSLSVALAGNGKSVPGLSPDSVQSLGVELALKKSKLAELNEKYTEMFPEVVRTKQEVAALERRIAEARRAAALAATDTNANPKFAAESLTESDEIRRMKGQLKATVAEIAAMKREKEEIRKRIASVEQKVDQSPRREQEMISLIRDYENQKKSYDDLVKKKLEADVSQNLEKRQKGTQFQILDPANLPEEPFQPNRKRVLGVFLLLALALGFGGTIFWEAMDLRVRDVRTFRQIYKVPILGYIPVFQDQKYERERAVRQATVFGGLITFTMAFSIFLLVYREKIRAILNF
jgi:regulator of replication initiation timing